MTFRNTLFGLLLSSWIVAPTAAQTAADIQWRKAIHGPAVDSDKAKDHVLFLEFWGIN